MGLPILKLAYEAIITPLGSYILLCIDGKARRNPCDKRARLWLFRLLLNLAKRFAGGCFACCGVAGGAVAGMAQGTGMDGGLNYHSTEAEANPEADNNANADQEQEVEPHEGTPYSLMHVVTAKRYGRFWRERAALHQRGLVPSGGLIHPSTGKQLVPPPPPPPRADNFALRRVPDVSSAPRAILGERRTTGRVLAAGQASARPAATVHV